MSLKTRNLTVQLGGGPALRLPDLDLDPGQCLDLHGPSGSGKTTMLRAVAGLVPGLSGRIENRFRRLGFAFQDSRLIPHLSARENVLFCRPPGERPLSRTALDEAFDALGLLGQAGQRAGELSGGEAQRVNLLRAVCLGPDLLLLDEIGANVDQATWALIEAFLARRRAETGSAILQVAHHHSRRIPADARLELPPRKDEPV